MQFVFAICDSITIFAIWAFQLWPGLSECLFGLILSKEICSTFNWKWKNFCNLNLPDLFRMAERHSFYQKKFRHLEKISAVKRNLFDFLPNMDEIESHFSNFSKLKLTKKVRFLAFFPNLFVVKRLFTLWAQKMILLSIPLFAFTIFCIVLPIHFLHSFANTYTFANTYLQYVWGLSGQRSIHFFSVRVSGAGDFICTFCCWN